MRLDAEEPEIGGSMGVDTPPSSRPLTEGTETDDYEADEEEDGENEGGDGDSDEDERPAKKRKRDTTAPRTLLPLILFSLPTRRAFGYLAVAV